MAIDIYGLGILLFVGLLFVGAVLAVIALAKPKH